MFPRYSHQFSPKKYTVPQLAACVLMSVYFKMSYRDFEELLLMSKELRDTLELAERHSLRGLRFEDVRCANRF